MFDLGLRLCGLLKAVLKPLSLYYRVIHVSKVRQDIVNILT